MGFYFFPFLFFFWFMLSVFCSFPSQDSRSCPCAYWRSYGLRLYPCESPDFACLFPRKYIPRQNDGFLLMPYPRLFFFNAVKSPLTPRRAFRSRFSALQQFPFLFLTPHFELTLSIKTASRLNRHIGDTGFTTILQPMGYSELPFRSSDRRGLTSQSSVLFSRVFPPLKRILACIYF